MKLSDLNFVRELRAELKRINEMIESVSSYPRMDGYINIDDRSLLLEHATVDRILADYKAIIVSKIQSYGVEVDE